MTPDWEEIGRKVRRFRVLNDMTQRELAGAAKVSVPLLSKIEHGTREVSAQTLGRIADALGVKVKMLIAPAELPYEPDLTERYHQIFSRDEPPQAWKRSAMQAVSRSMDAHHQIAVLFGEVKAAPVLVQRGRFGRQHKLLLQPFDPAQVARGDVYQVMVDTQTGQQIEAGDKVMVVAVTISQWMSNARQHVAYFQAIFTAVTTDKPDPRRLDDLKRRLARYLIDQ